MTTTLQQLPSQRNWLEKRTSQWGRLRGSWTLRPTLRSSGSGSLVGSTKNIYAKWLFHHATATGKSEHDYAICWGRWEPSAEWDVEGEPTVMELVWPDSSWKDAAELYHDVYQLQRLLGKICCDKVMKARICQEIINSDKEHLLHKHPFALLEAEPRQSPADIHRLNPQPEFNARNHATYDRFMGSKWDSCEEALAMPRDAHQQALSAATLLEHKIERMSCSLSCSCQCSGSHRCLGSCWQRRSGTVDHQTTVPQVMSHHRDPARRWAQ